MLKKYTEGDFVTKIIDNEHHLLIIPEIYTNYIANYKKY
jgi:hypothetical protein